MPTGILRMCAISRKSMMSSVRRRCADFLQHGGPMAEQLPREAAPHLQGAPRHDVVERRHALEQGDVLEGAGDTLAGGEIGAHVVPPLALERDHTLLRVIEAVDDVEHRRLAGAVGANDGAHLALADIEGDVAQRAHAAEGERHVFQREQHIAGERSRQHPSSRASARRRPSFGGLPQGLGGVGRVGLHIDDAHVAPHCCPCGRPRRSPRCRNGNPGSRRTAP